MKWKQISVAIVAVGALTAAAACGSPAANSGAGKGGDAGKSAKPLPTGKIGDAMDASAKAPAAPIPGAKKGGTVTVYTAVAPSTLDPTRAYYVDASEILKLVTRSLTQYKYDQKTGKMVLVPDMATDLGQHNADFTQWTFKLRPGLKYEDGSPVKAADIAYAIKRQFAVSELPDGPTYLLTFMKDGDTYKGPFKDKGKAFAGVEAPDDSTVVMHFRKPFADLSFFASFPDFTGIPEAKDTQTDYGNHPLATGPYKFASYNPGKSLTLVRNKYWDPNTDTARHNYVDKWEFKFGGVTSKFHASLINDAEPTALTYDNLQAEDIPKLQTNKGAEDRVTRGRQNCVSSVYFDMRKITNPDVRKAIGLAWPIDQETKAGGDIPGDTWIPSTTLLPTTDTGRKDFDVYGRGGKGPGDPKAAKALLKKAGALNYKLSWFYTNDSETGPKVNTVRVAALKAAGFDPQPIGKSSAQIRSALADTHAPTNLRITGWCEDWPSGASVFPAQWDPRYTETAGAPNPAYPTDKNIAKKIDAILKMPVDKAIPAWGDLDEYIMKQYPAIQIGQGNVSMLHGSKIKNMVDDENFGMPSFQDIWVAQ